MSRHGDLAVIGGGFVGLNAAVHAALRGFNVTVVDVKEDVVARINSGGELHVKDPYIVDNWESVRGRIRATSSYWEVKGFKYYVVAVNTPLKVYGKTLLEKLESGGGSMDDFIDFKPLEAAAKSLGEVVGRGSLIASEVTIYPGGTVERLSRIVEDVSRLALGEGFFTVHSPERINPGDRVWNVSNIPRVLGAPDRASLEKGLELYSEKLAVKIAKVTGIREAEYSKLLENSQRLVNIALASSLKTGGDAAGLNYSEALEAASTKPFGFQPYRPGYAGGPCLLKDSVMLYAWMVDNNVESPFTRILRDAIVANELYITRVASKIAAKARDSGFKRILFHGLGYKPGSQYFISEDLNYPWRVMMELRNMGFEVKSYDPDIPWKSDFKDYSEARSWADIVVGWGREGGLRLEHL